MEKGKALLIVFTLLQQYALTSGLVGFDCGNHIANITTISLLDVGECDIKEAPINVSSINGQLLQINDFDITYTYKCSIKITRVVTYCGAYSHASRMSNGEASYYKEITRDECLKIQSTGFSTVYNVPISGVLRNSTINRPVVFAGSVDKKGNCKGGSFNDEYGQYNDVYVAGWIEITLQDYYAEISLNDDVIKLRSGVSCKFSKGECEDYDGSNVFWKKVPLDDCKSRQYSLLYEGKIDKINEINDNKTLYSLEMQDITFALWKKGETKICGRQLIVTEHPKLIILENNEDSFVSKEPALAANLDMFAFINSKFVYVEKYVRKQLTNMYYDILRHKCELERKLIDQALSLATVAPEELAFKIMGEQGYIAVTSGEVIHLLKCVKAEVVQREVENKCFEQLPVRKGQEDLFLSPRTRILIKEGRLIPCDKRLPIMYKLNGLWYKLLPEPIEVKAPETLRPQTKPTWKYVSPETLAVSGIYSANDLRRLRDRILFPVEKPAIIHKLALGITGGEIENESINMYNLFNKETISKLAESAWNSIWTKFMSFGTASAGLIGVLMLCRLIKLLIDTVIHGYALYSIYGFSIHLIGSIWNSVTQLLLHLGQRKKEETRSVTNNEASKKNINEGDKENQANKNRECEDKTEKIYPEITIDEHIKHNSL